MLLRATLPSRFILSQQFMHTLLTPEPYTQKSMSLKYEPMQKSMGLKYEPVSGQDVAACGAAIALHNLAAVSAHTLNPEPYTLYTTLICFTTYSKKVYGLSIRARLGTAAGCCCVRRCHHGSYSRSSFCTHSGEGERVLY